MYRLLGATLISAKRINDEIEFIDTDGTKYILKHMQECCETVYIEDIIGNLDNLVGTPIVQAEESVSRRDDEMTWTFYKLATVKGYVTIRFYGTSNGYYSEAAELYVSNE